MHVAECVGFCIVMFLALYGVIGLLRQLSLMALKPPDRLCTFTVAYVNRHTENAEQLIRYFRAQAGKEQVLLLVDNGVTAEQATVIRKLCENRRDIRFLSETETPDGIVR